MSHNIVAFMRGCLSSAALITLIALPLAAHAVVDIDPGDTASGLVADGGNVLEECATTANETCTVAINAAANEVGALVAAEPPGAGVASGEVFADFHVSGDADAVLPGSSVSAQVDVAGVLAALAADAMASVEVSLQVKDMTAGVLVGAQSVVGHTVVNGSLPVSHSKAVVIPVALTRGHDYRISLIIAAEAAGSVAEVIGAESDFVNTASWSDLSVTAGRDPFGAIARLAGRVSDLEALVDRIANALRDLQRTVAQLREDFENHTHTYLTGKGAGHNKVDATTTTPSGDGGAVTLPGNSGNAPPAVTPPGNSGDAGSQAGATECSGRDKRHGRC